MAGFQITMSVVCCDVKRDLYVLSATERKSIIIIHEETLLTNNIPVRLISVYHARNLVVVLMTKVFLFFKLYPAPFSSEQ